MTRAGDIRIGVSGWTYKPWRGAFFPKGLPQSRELAYASAAFRAIEINGTFYSMQRPSSFLRWSDETPADFVFTVKGPRFITHLKRLRDVEAPLANFFASGVLRLGPKLGPILWQFPPNFRFDPDRIEPFARLLPHDTDAAIALARRHDQRLKGEPWLTVDRPRALRHAMEIRHESFRDTAFIDLLRRHRIALVCADTVKWPRLMDVTADFVYCRLHGSHELYRSGYSAGDLDEWAARVRAWTRGGAADGDTVGERRADRRARDVFLFFDNTDKLHAPDNARDLMRRLGQDVPEVDARLSASRKRPTAKTRTASASAAE